MRQIKIFGLAFVITGLFLTGLVLFGLYQKKSLPAARPPLFEKPIAFEPVPKILLPAAVKANATEALAKKLAQELLQENPQGPAALEGQKWLKALTPEELISRLDFKPEELRPKINPARIKIATADDAPAAEKYLKNFQKITAEQWPDLAAVDYEILIQGLGTALEQFYQLAAPPRLAGIHEKEIELLALQKLIFEKLRDHETDPVAAVVAASAYPGLEAAFAELKTEITQLIQTHGWRI